MTLSVTALIRKESLGRKVSEDHSGVGMRLSVKFEGDACKNESVMPGHRHANSYILHSNCIVQIVCITLSEIRTNLDKCCRSSRGFCRHIY